MQAMARRPRTNAVRTTVNDVEIVVDSSEAREKGWVVQTGLVEPGFQDSVMEFDVSAPVPDMGALYGLDPELR
jgi:hypothetical protein